VPPIDPALFRLSLNLLRGISVSLNSFRPLDRSVCPSRSCIPVSNRRALIEMARLEWRIRRTSLSRGASLPFREARDESRLGGGASVVDQRNRLGQPMKNAGYIGKLVEPRSCEDKRVATALISADRPRDKFMCRSGCTSPHKREPSRSRSNEREEKMEEKKMRRYSRRFPSCLDDPVAYFPQDFVLRAKNTSCSS